MLKQRIKHYIGVTNESQSGDVTCKGYERSGGFLLNTGNDSDCGYPALRTLSMSRW